MLREFEETCLRYSYQVTYLVINTKHLGIPQDRKRVFIVAHRVKLQTNFAWKVEGPTLGEVLDEVLDFEEVNLNQLQTDLLPRLKQGEKMRKIFQETYGDNVKGKPSLFRKRLDRDKLCPVIQTHADYFHPTEHRLINPSEAAALCGYPLDYVFVGGQSDRFQQVGAAVLPCAGEFMARVAKLSLEKDELNLFIQTSKIDLS
jgi:site-specific DNA-cytosine methylase